MIFAVILLICLVTYLAAKRHANVFNQRDRSGDYRTSVQRWGGKR